LAVNGIFTIISGIPYRNSKAKLRPPGIVQLPARSIYGRRPADQPRDCL